MRRSVIEHGPHPVDLHVGGRLKQIRGLRGLSQTNLADSVGLTFQQIQKYENGANRISASRLWEFAERLNVPISFFYDGLDDSRDNIELEVDRMALELVRALQSIKDDEVRRRLYELAKMVSKHTDEPED